MKRRTPATRASGLLLLLVVTLVQPQVLCGLHCAFFAGSVPMGAAAGHHGGHAPGALCQGHTMTGRRTIPVGRLAAAWLPSVAAGSLPVPVRAVALPAPGSLRPSSLRSPESPPPRA